jgi:hypothetical protein
MYKEVDHTTTIRSVEAVLGNFYKTISLGIN